MIADPIAQAPPFRVVHPILGNSRNEVPVIVGNARVGNVLYAVAGQLLDHSVASLKTTLQWYKDGAAISGATGASYTPVVADAGSTITVRQRDEIGILSRTAESAATATIGQRFNATIPSGWTYTADTLTATATSATANFEVQTAPGRSYTVAFDFVRTGGTLYLSLDGGLTSANTATSGAKSFTLAASASGRLWFYGGVVSGTITNLTITPVDAGTLLSPGPYSLDAAEISKLNGPLMDNHTLGNIKVGGATPERRAIWYFKATENSAVSTARIFFTATGDANGYAHGTGGEIRIRIWPVDVDGFTPDESGSNLGEATYTPGLLNGLFQGTGPNYEHLVHTFSGTSALTKGTVYALVFENVNADKENNWISVDCFSHRDNGDWNEWVYPADWGAAYHDRANQATAWSASSAVNRGDINASTTLKPCMELTYANAAKFGIASIYTGNIGNRVTECQAHTPSRAEIILATAKTFRGAYLYVSARDGDQFVWVLRHTAGRVLASGVATVAYESYETIFSLKMYAQKRVTLDFGIPIYIANASTHYLEIRPIGDTKLLLATNHDGRVTSASYTARFAKAEHSAQRYNFAAAAWWYDTADPAQASSSNVAPYPLILVEV